MEFVCYREWSDLPESANTLFEQGEQHSLFNSRSWYETLAENALNDDQSILFACVKEREKLVAILPLMELPQNCVRSLSNHYSTLYSLLIESNEPKHAILNCLADGLSQLSFQSLRLEPIDQKDQALLALRQALEIRNFNAHLYFRIHNWAHRLEGASFAEYMADRPAKLRNTIERKKRKLEREQNPEFCLIDNKNIDQALQDYYAVYHKSWKGNEMFAKFKPALVKKLAQRGWLRLAILYINKQPAAAQIWFVVHAKANIYRLAYDPAWQQYSPGSILTQYLIQYVIENDQVTEIDFLTGNESYKQDWMSEHRERFGMQFVRQPKSLSLFSRILVFAKRILTNSKTTVH